MQGITLIALVVTIIVLLILAGIALNLTIGENGIFKRAEKAANTWRNAETNEQLALGEFIELPKYRRKKDKTYTKKEQWLSLIAGGKEKKMARLDEPKVKEALKLVEEVLVDSKERDLYESRKLEQYDRYCVRKHGEEIGRRKGRTQGISQVAINMLKEKCDKKVIKKCTGLSDKQISELEKSLQSA